MWLILGLKVYLMNLLDRGSSKTETHRSGTATVGRSLKRHCTRFCYDEKERGRDA